MGFRSFGAGILWKIFPSFYDRGVKYNLPYIYLIKEVEQTILTNVSDKKEVIVVDACCGTGNFAVAIKKVLPNAKVLGVDFSPEMIARAKSKNDKINFIIGDIIKTMKSIETISCDIVLLINGFYPIFEKQLLLTEIKRILRIGGIFILSDPCKNASLLKIIRQHIRIKGIYGYVQLIPALGGVIISALLQYGVKYVFLKIDDAISLIQKSGLSVIEKKTTYADQNYYIVATKR